MRDLDVVVRANAVLLGRDRVSPDLLQELIAEIESLRDQLKGRREH